MPRQGDWTDEGISRLTDHRTRLIEFTDGLEVSPMPTDKHQAILGSLLCIPDLHQRVAAKVRFSPLRLRIRPGKFREPDLTLIAQPATPAAGSLLARGRFGTEVVSPDKPDRDLIEQARRLRRSRRARVLDHQPGRRHGHRASPTQRNYEGPHFRRGDTAASCSCRLSVAVAHLYADYSSFHALCPDKSEA